MRYKKLHGNIFRGELDVKYVFLSDNVFPKNEFFFNGKTKNDYFRLESPSYDKIIEFVYSNFLVDRNYLYLYMYVH